MPEQGFYFCALNRVITLLAHRDVQGQLSLDLRDHSFLDMTKDIQLGLVPGHKVEKIRFQFDYFL